MYSKVIKNAPRSNVFRVVLQPQHLGRTPTTGLYRLSSPSLLRWHLRLSLHSLRKASDLSQGHPTLEISKFDVIGYGVAIP